MINSIDINMIRRMCDKAGYNSKITDGGMIEMIFETNSNFNRNVAVFFGVDDNKWLKMYSTCGRTASKYKLADTLFRVNKINIDHRLIRAYVDDDGDVILSRQEMIDEYVSEEWVYENFIKLLPQATCNLWEEYFSDL